ncbi:MAG TPA: SAM-dependent methyltransferase [Ktedonobacteraceae bacterium]|nr:SAM-dependent methyltransferase [Ktedonobacteraceae bacterium]
MMVVEYKEQVKRLVLDEQAFVRLTMKGLSQDADVPWRQVVVRPVLIKHERYLQISYLSQKQDITKNYRGADAVQKLDELLALPFSSVLVQSTVEDLRVQITPRGKVILHRDEAANGKREPQLAHDSSKKLLLPAGKPDAFLQATGIMDNQGRVRPSMQGKFSQINEFLKLLEHTGELEHFKTTPVHILDCGCGSAYLSFAAYHYLNNVRGVPAELTGIDTNATLIRKDNGQSEELGFSQACFLQSAIIDFVPQEPPDIILALHACDTATDEALYQGIVAESKLILCAPCCHHHLRKQLHPVKPFTPIFHDGILEQRLSEILTDTFRALILRIMGYKTDVVEFVSPEHTDKNLMIRAVRRTQRERARYMQEYLDLKTYWGVTPYLETLLGERFR